MIRLVMMLAAVVATPRQGIDRPVEFLQFEQVRDRLPAGGSRIRTTGPSRQECCFFAPTRGAEANRMVAEASISFEGTSSSNPAHSGGESCPGGEDISVPWRRSTIESA